MSEANGPAEAWIDAMIAAGGGTPATIRSFADAYNAPVEPHDPTVSQEFALPSASKDGKPKPSARAPFGDGPRRIVHVFDPPTPPKRFERRYTADGQCLLIEITEPEPVADEAEAT
jgi:hypothetical protein